MKKIIKLLLIVIMIFSWFNVSAKEKIKLYLFYGDGCPHCAEEESSLLPELEKDEDLEIVKYEVWYDKENSKLLDNVVKVFNGRSGVPFNVIGDTTIIGYSDSNKNKILRAIDYYKNNSDKYRDVVKKIHDGEEVTINDTFEKEEKKSDKESTIDVPIFGKFNVKNISLTSAAVLIGLVDGFNPCAMWVLLFLLTSLIGMKNKRRMFILGSIFLLTSGLVYFIIMFSWLNVVVSVTASVIFRILIGLFALGAGIYNINNYCKEKKKDDGCSVVDKKERKNIIGKIKKFTKEKSLFLAILGVMALAVSVNIVELLCSAGLPLVFSELLAINNISGLKAVLYDLIYIFFFMLDDFIIFLIAIKTMDVVGISTKYSKYSHLVGGIIMLLIGLLLLFKPGWLMFNF